MKKILLGALASLSFTSMTFASSYFCESDKVEVIVEPISGSQLYQLGVLNKDSQETIFLKEASAYLGTGADATFNVPGEAILIIDAAGFGDLTFTDKTYANLECELN